jgi:hypothetical protein
LKTCRSNAVRRWVLSLLTRQEARDALRLDGEANDAVIQPLIDAIPDFLHIATGYAPRGSYSPVARTAARFILQLWYYGDTADTGKLERIIECLLKALSAERETV